MVTTLYLTSDNGYYPRTESRYLCHGLPLTCSSQGAVDSFNEGLVAFVTLRKSPVSSFRAALDRER